IGNATAGVPISVTVTARDQFGNTATSYAGTVHFTSTDAQASLPTNYTFAAADNGVHALSPTLKTTGSQTVTATDTISSSITGTTNPIAVSAAPASSLSARASTGPTTAGVPIGVTVTARDLFGNTATSYTGTVR